jgi:organic radical activating enzyme
MASKSCSLKGNQKVFYFLTNQIASCCRADAEVLNPAHDLNFYLQKWNHESDLLNRGVELPGCRHCWQQENNNQISYRQVSSNIVNNTIELWMSNLCNQMCSYCGPKFSSVWQESIANEGMFQKISNTAKTNLQVDFETTDTTHWVDQISQYIESCPNNSVTIKLLGGEPLMQQRNLKNLLLLNSSKVKNVIVNTNLNPPTNKFLQWVLANVDSAKLVFHISLDASPDYNHWPRARFDKKKFADNLDLLETNGISTVFSAVVSVLGMFDLDNFITWANRKQTTIIFYKLYNPECLDPTLLPQEFKEKIWQKIKNLDPPEVLREILQQPTKTNPIKLFEQYNYLAQYFERNAMDPAHSNNVLLEEYWQWLTQNYKK